MIKKNPSTVPAANRCACAFAISRANKKGFNLIELLVVLTIVLVLASLLLPAMHGAKAKAKDLYCRGNLRSMGQALVTFAADHDSYLPSGGGVHNAQDAFWRTKPWMTDPWMGKEVLLPGENVHSWPYGRVGTLASYLSLSNGSNDSVAVKNARKIYRCPNLLEGPTQNSTENQYSNGRFDYAMMQFWFGARVSLLRHTSEIRIPGQPTITAPSPVIVEEDPGWWLNRGPNMEPQHGNIDRLGDWHEGSGNYLSTSMNVISYDLPWREVEQPFAKEWYIQRTVDGQWHNMGGGYFYKWQELK